MADSKDLEESGTAGAANRKHGPEGDEVVSMTAVTGMYDPKFRIDLRIIELIGGKLVDMDISDKGEKEEA